MSLLEKKRVISNLKASDTSLLIVIFTYIYFSQINEMLAVPILLSDSER